MNSTYAQKSSTVQKAADTKAASVLDSSSQGESLQRKADMANGAVQREESPRPNNTGMPDNLKAGIESLSGFSMDDVRVHYNSPKPATVQALAYTQGTDIHVAPGQEKHLPHEAWHVAQQMAGCVSPTTNINGMPVNDNAALEHEADVMGEKAVQCKMIVGNFTKGKMRGLVAQRKASYKGSASETEQYESDETLAKMFGREIENGKYKRPLKVARKVDQYKKEMLTYIGCCIEDLGQEKKISYGPHISVVITNGIWFIAINSNFVSKDVVEHLKHDADVVKEDVVKKWNEMENHRKEIFPDVSEKTPQKETDVLEDEYVQKQAMYIVYRWAGKNNGVIVKHNEQTEKNVSLHGEMCTIKFLQSIASNGCDAFGTVENQLTEALHLLENEPQNSELKDEISSLVGLTNGAIEKALSVKKMYENLKAKESSEYDESIKKEIEGYNVSLKEIYTKYKEISDQKMMSKMKIINKYIGFVNCANSVKKMFDSDENGVIRVGGTKTACYDCAYEMHLHADPKNGKIAVHGAEPRMTAVKNRNVVTMNSCLGKVFESWTLDKEHVRSCSVNSGITLLSYNHEQDQDYNELFFAYNRIMGKVDGEYDPMKITDSMLNVWLNRADDFVCDVDVLPKLASFDLKKLCEIRKKMIEYIDCVYASEKVEGWEFGDREINDYVETIQTNANGNKEKITSDLKNIVKKINSIIHTQISVNASFDLQKKISLKNMIVKHLESIYGKKGEAINIPDIYTGDDEIDTKINSLLNDLRSRKCLNVDELIQYERMLVKIIDIEVQKQLCIGGLEMKSHDGAIRSANKIVSDSPMIHDSGKDLIKRCINSRKRHHAKQTLQKIIDENPNFYISLLGFADIVSDANNILNSKKDKKLNKLKKKIGNFYEKLDVVVENWKYFITCDLNEMPDLHEVAKKLNDMCVAMESVNTQWPNVYVEWSFAPVVSSAFSGVTNDMIFVFVYVDAMKKIFTSLKPAVVELRASF